MIKNLRRLILGFILALSACLGVNAQTANTPEPYFPYPLVPDSIQTFQGRCDFLARHFWDFCELSKAFSAKQKMANEFAVYLSILRNATVDSALASVDRLAKKLEKQPNDLLFLAQKAEGLLYSDTAEAWVDGLYLPFAEAVVNNKKIDKASKARFAHQATVLKNSMIGKIAGDLPYTTLSGEQRHLSADTAEILVVFFNDPDCSDCNMARLRLDADISTTELINEGRLKIVSISLTEPGEEWRKAMEGYPSTWILGANPDADLVYDLRAGTPEFYILDRRHKVRFKHLSIDQMLDVTRQLKKR